MCFQSTFGTNVAIQSGSFHIFFPLFVLLSLCHWHVMYTYIHVCMYVCMYLGMYVHIYLCIFVCTYVCIYVCFLFMYICMYVCMYLCMFSIYVYLYVHMHMYTAVECRHVNINLTHFPIVKKYVIWNTVRKFSYFISFVCFAVSMPFGM